MLNSKGSDKSCKKRTYLYPINIAFLFIPFFFSGGGCGGLWELWIIYELLVFSNLLPYSGMSFRKSLASGYPKSTWMLPLRGVPTLRGSPFHYWSAPADPRSTVQKCLQCCLQGDAQRLCSNLKPLSPVSSFMLTWGSSSKAADKGARTVKGPGPTRSRTECSCRKEGGGHMPCT